MNALLNRIIMMYIGVVTSVVIVTYDFKYYPHDVGYSRFYAQGIHTEEELIAKLHDEATKRNQYLQLINMEKHYCFTKFGFPNSTRILYDAQYENAEKPCVIYSKRNQVESQNYPFRKISSDSMFMKYDFSNWRNSGVHVDTVSYRICDSTLFVNSSNSSEFAPLFALEYQIEQVNKFGRYYISNHYDSIEFMGYLFRDVYEINMITTDDDDNHAEYLLWFNHDFDLFRIDEIGDVLGRGFIVIPDSCAGVD